MDRTVVVGSNRHPVLAVAGCWFPSELPSLMVQHIHASRGHCHAGWILCKPTIIGTETGDNAVFPS